MHVCVSLIHAHIPTNTHTHTHTHTHARTHYISIYTEYVYIYIYIFSWVCSLQTRAEESPLLVLFLVIVGSEIEAMFPPLLRCSSDIGNCCRTWTLGRSTTNTSQFITFFPREQYLLIRKTRERTEQCFCIIFRWDVKAVAGWRKCRRIPEQCWY